MKDHLRQETNTTFCVLAQIEDEWEKTIRTSLHEEFRKLEFRKCQSEHEMPPYTGLAFRQNASGEEFRRNGGGEGTFSPVDWWNFDF